MNPNLQRANHLIDVGRFDFAVTELMSHLAEDPNDSQALSLLAFCHLKMKRYKAATEAAEAAISADPSQAHGFYIMAQILRERNQPAPAMEAIQVALTLEPADPDFLVVLSHLHLDAKRWEEALAAAQLAVERSPHHVGAVNALATCLIGLRRIGEAASALENALEQDPENAQTLANMGWLELDRNRYGDALEHFQRALLADPESEWARDGLLHALRSRYPLYGVVLRYMLWMSKHSHKLQQQITLATYIGARVLRELLARYPGLAVVMGPLLVVWRLFCYLTWTIRAATTLLLRFSKHGRAIVNREEVLESNLVGGAWLAALVIFLYHYYIDPFTYLGKVGPAVFLSLPMIWSGPFDCSPGWPRKASTGITAVLSIAALVGLLFLQIDLGVAVQCLRFYGLSLGPALLIQQYLAAAKPEK